MSTKRRWVMGTVGTVSLGEAALIFLGRTYGSTRAERAMALPGDRIVGDPKVVTDHAITIDTPPSAVWPWLVQMGWGRGGPTEGSRAPDATATLSAPRSATRPRGLGGPEVVRRQLA